MKVRRLNGKRRRNKDGYSQIKWKFVNPAELLNSFHQKGACEVAVLIFQKQTGNLRVHSIKISSWVEKTVDYMENLKLCLAYSVCYNLSNLVCYPYFQAT